MIHSKMVTHAKYKYIIRYQTHQHKHPWYYLIISSVRPVIAKRSKAISLVAKKRTELPINLATINETAVWGLQ